MQHARPEGVSREKVAPMLLCSAETLDFGDKRPTGIPNFLFPPSFRRTRALSQCRLKVSSQQARNQSGPSLSSQKERRVAGSMIHDPNDAGHIASEYLRLHGGEAILCIDADMTKALDADNWDHYSLLRGARLRLRRLELFEQISRQLSASPNGGKRERSHPTAGGQSGRDGAPVRTTAPMA